MDLNQIGSFGNSWWASVWRLDGVRGLDYDGHVTWRSPEGEHTLSTANLTEHCLYGTQRVETAVL